MANPDDEEATAALVEALQVFVSLADREVILDEEETVWNEALDKARAALAKAEGD
jgi:hypothetical protein